MPKPGSQREMLAQLIHQIVITDDGMRIELRTGALRERLLGEDGEDTEPDSDPIVIEASVRIARRGVESRLVIDAPNGAGGQARDESLIRAIAVIRRASLTP